MIRLDDSEPKPSDSWSEKMGKDHHLKMSLSVIVCIRKYSYYNITIACSLCALTRCVSDDDGSGEDDIKSEPKPCNKGKDHHWRKYCPVCGCYAGPQVRLAWHMKKEHSNIPRTTRLMMTKQTLVLERRVALPSQPKGTSTLETLFTRQVKQQSS